MRTSSASTVRSHKLSVRQAELQDQLACDPGMVCPDPATPLAPLMEALLGRAVLLYSLYLF